MKKLSLAVCVVIGFATVGSVAAQVSGRPQDGFYSGQSNGQYNGQSAPETNGRVDGRAGQTGGVAPSEGDAVKRISPSSNVAPLDAESMDSVVRPNATR